MSNTTIVFDQNTQLLPSTDITKSTKNH